MNYHQLLSSLTPDIYANLKQAVELGKWPDGNSLSDEQRQLCMEAVIVYEQKNLPPEQRTGYIAPKTGSSCTDDNAESKTEQPLKWR